MVMVIIRRRYLSFWCQAGHSWSSLNVPEPIHRALVHAGYTAPSLAQSLTLEAIRESPRALHLGMQTGTGKTLAYLIPVLERLLSRPSTSSLLLGSSLELCHQVKTVCDRILSGLSPDLPCVYLQPSMIPSKLSEAKIVIATPIVAERILLPRLHVNQFGSVVGDEADFMLNGGSGQQKALQSILQKTSKNMDCQHIIAGATMPPFALKYLERLFPDLKSVRGENSISATVKRLYIPVAGDFISQLRGVVIPGERTLVFCNTTAMAETVVAVCSWLKKVALFSSAITPENRCLLLDGFNNQQIDVLICTDAAARGIDFVNVDHVVEVPLALDSMTHLHRIGRTGRCGQQGRSTSFYDEGRSALVAMLESAEPGESIAAAFTRKRSFRKKQKKALASAKMA